MVRLRRSKIHSLTCARAIVVEGSGMTPSAAALLRSTALLPIAVAQRGSGLSFVEITPKGMFWSVKGESSGISKMEPIMIEDKQCE